jgi:hypothetical protein
MNFLTEERQEAGGRRQESENIFFAICQMGLKPLNLFMGIPSAFSQGETLKAICLLNFFFGKSTSKLKIYRSEIIPKCYSTV